MMLQQTAPDDEDDASPGPVAAPSWSGAPLVDPNVDTSAPAWAAAPTVAVPPDVVRAHVYQMLGAKNPDMAAIHQYLRASSYQDTPDVDLAGNWLKDHPGHGADIPVVVKPGGQVTLGDTSPQTIPGALWEGTKDTVVGIGEGLAAIPDLATEGLGKVMSIVPTAVGSGLDALGYADAGNVAHNVAHNLANPVTIGSLIESAAGPAKNTEGRIERGAAAFGSGLFFGDPSGITGATVTRLAGGPMPNALAAVRPASGQQVYQAADRLGVANTLMPANVAGNGTRMATSVASMGLGGKFIADQAAKGVNALGVVRDATAEGVGSVVDNTGAGQALQSGAKSFIQSSGDRASQLYDAIPIAADKPAILTSTKQTLADLNAGLRSNPALSAMVTDPKLKAYEDAITSGGTLSWQDLKAFRSYIGEKAGQPTLQSDTSQRALKAIYGSLSDDMAATAQSEGPDALQAFNRANTYYRGRQDRISTVLNAVLGNDMNKAPSAAFEGVQRMSQTKGGDPIRLGRLIRSLPGDEADTVRANVIDRLGTASPGKQDAEGGVFSPAEFATQWNKLDPRAKATLFNNPDVRSALNDIATVASGMKSSAKFANTPNTGLIVNGMALVQQAFNHISQLPYLGGVAATQLSAGKLLASPGLARAIANLSRVRTPGAAKAAIARISAVGARDATIRPTTDAMVRSLNDNLPQAGSLAASPDQRPNQSDQQP